MNPTLALHLLVFDPASRRVLVTQRGHRFATPKVLFTRRVRLVEQAERFCAELEIDGELASVAYADGERGNASYTAIVRSRTGTPVRTPAGMQWLDLDGFDPAACATRYDSAIIESFASDTRAPEHTSAAPFLVSDWRPRARASIAAACSWDVDDVRVDHVFRAAPSRIAARLQTPAGLLFLKLHAARNAEEETAALLERICPERVPACVVAQDGIWLSRPLGTTSLTGGFAAADMHALYDLATDLERRTAPHAAQLLNAGAEDFRLTRVADDLHHFLAAPEQLIAIVRRRLTGPDVWLHMDPAPSNVVRLEGSRLGMIDFEYSAVGPASIFGLLLRSCLRKAGVMTAESSGSAFEDDAIAKVLWTLLALRRASAQVDSRERLSPVSVLKTTLLGKLEAYASCLSTEYQPEH